MEINLEKTQKTKYKIDLGWSRKTNQRDNDSYELLTSIVNA